MQWGSKMDSKKSGNFISYPAGQGYFGARFLPPIMFDFDNIDDWAPEFAFALKRYVSASVKRKLIAAAPEYIEDARTLLFEFTDKDAVIDTVLDLFRSKSFIAYHGTRLTDAEVLSVKSSGLIPLKAENRRHRLTRALSSHPKWNEVSGSLDAVIQSHGRGKAAGGREGQVNLTISRAGLIGSFNHYLTHGSEFDQCVTHALLGSEAVKLLSYDGEPRVVRVAIPGDLALDAAHSVFSIDDFRAKGEIPNLVKEFLQVWSYSLAYKGFQSRTLKADFGLRFRSTVPPEWIINFDTLKEPLGNSNQHPPSW
jgi:hypothetical protein